MIEKIPGTNGIGKGPGFNTASYDRGARFGIYRSSHPKGMVIPPDAERDARLIHPDEQTIKQALDAVFGEE